MLIEIALTCLLLALGLLMLAKPKALWRVGTMLWVKQGEPTNLYLTYMRLTGTLFLIIALILLITIIRSMS